jgi:molybdate transport system ATP-binding protein
VADASTRPGPGRSTSSGQGLSVEIRQQAPIPLDVRFACGSDQVVAIFGPSGSGKTTLLRTIAGLYRPAHARIACDGEVWTDTVSGRHLPTRERRVGFVFQDYALFPHLTARGNVMSALGDRRKGERADEADRLLASVHLAGLETRRPAELSGGQRQRVALARALARNPRALLLDEPFAASDRALRGQLHDELDELRRRTRIPVLLVTHDFHDVVRLATDVVLLDRGGLIAAGPVDSVTSRTDIPWPRLLEGAGSVVNAAVARTDRARGLAELAVGSQPVLVPLRDLEPGRTVRLRIPAREVILATRRPEGLSLHNVLRGRVEDMSRTADGLMLVQVRIGAAQILAEVTPDAVQRLALERGAEVFALIKSVSIDVHGAGR